MSGDSSACKSSVGSRASLTMHLGQGPKYCCTTHATLMHGSSVQRHGATVVGPAEGYEDDERTEASLLRGKAERARLVQP